MNLPNALTICRLLGIPVLMALLLINFPGHDQVAAAMFIVFSLTDTLDGQLARRSGKVSDLGKFLDPLADKLFVLSVLIVLVQEGLIAAWVVIVIFSRELIITILRSVGAGQGRAIAAAPLGKTKTVTQMSAVTLLILQRPYPALAPLAGVAVAVAVVFTLWSGLDYLWRFRYLISPFDTSRARVTSGGAPERSLAADLGEVLRARALTVSVGESCTGGLVGAAITEVPGSSAYFMGGVIAYSNAVKHSHLDVPADMLEAHGAVSREVAEAMAKGARSRFGTDLAVGVTGIAGPDSDGSSKPVGLIYVAVATEARVWAGEFHFHGDRQSIRQQATAEALRMLIVEARSLDREQIKSA
jgi:CDP-diacylglycerol--glycerol-3-phosphate 3-phosphatidyltransferase